MLMGDPGTDHNRTPSWKLLWDNSRGWHVDVNLNGAKSEDSSSSQREEKAAT